MTNLAEVLAIVESLEPLDKLKLMERLAVSLETHLSSAGSEHPRKPLYGIWSDVDVSVDDIDAVRRDLWGNFPREGLL